MAEKAKMKKMLKNEQEWKERLSPEQYHVLRERGTERPFTGKLLHNKEKGTYQCAGCGMDIFSSDSKFDSGTGWPSFFKPLSPDRIVEKDDFAHLMHRIEVLCARCGGHLGHVFRDGPKPTGLRYCINSCSLEFNKKA